VVVGILRKVIFTALASVIAWGLSSVLYHIWMSGQIYQTGRNGLGSYYSYSSDHALFMIFFSLKVCLALCGVLLVLGLGWMKKSKIPEPVRTKPPVHWVLLWFVLIWILLATIYLVSHSHGDSFDGRLWFLFVLDTAAIAWGVGRLLMRRSTFI
jgi:hypothetical protein